MHPLNRDHRVIALDVRARRFAYAIFEGPEYLLDWGAKGFRGGVNAVRIPFGIKITQILSEWQPHVLLVQSPYHPEIGPKIRILQEQAKRYRIQVRFVNRGVLADAFPSSRSKYETARLIVASFPELTTRLPPKPRAWRSENHRLSIFDAAALGVAYFWQLQQREVE